VGFWRQRRRFDGALEVSRVLTPLHDRSRFRPCAPRAGFGPTPVRGERRHRRYPGCLSQDSRMTIIAQTRPWSGSRRPALLCTSSAAHSRTLVRVPAHRFRLAVVGTK
jgi:hypothetical protein